MKEMLLGKIVAALCLLGCSAWAPSVKGAAQRSLYRRTGSLRMAQFDIEVDDGDEDEDESVENQINWLPPLTMTAELEKDEGAQVFPLFPLGSVVYLPNTEHILSIFEPRYRSMYNDILLSGGRSFATCMVNEETGQFAETAMIFYLDELKEVSQQTNDQVKYICKHQATRRVNLRKVLNPKVWKDRSTYLRVQVEDLEDVDKEESYPDDDQLLMQVFREVVDLQDRLKEEPRFSPTLFSMFNSETNLEDEEVWSLVNLWQTLANERVGAVRKAKTDEIEAKLMKYITKDGKVSPKAGQVEIPKSLQVEITAMTNKFRREMAEMADLTTVPFQRMLQTNSRQERVRILYKLILDEKRRLEAIVSLKALFPTAP